MELDTLILVFILFSVSSYLIMQTSLIDYIFGFALLSNGINLMILFTSENPEGRSVPILTEGVVKNLADPLPQALILTAIVIGFGLIAFMIVLAFRLFGYFGTLDTNNYMKMHYDD